MIPLGSYEPLVLNKYINVDNAYGAQCWDLIGHYTDWLGLPRINTFGGQYHGWAMAIWDQYASNGAAKYWTKIGPTQPAVQGDIAIWRPTPGIYPSSHIAIAVEDAGANIWCLSQNSSPSLPGNPYQGHSTGPTIKQLLPKTGLAGYLRRTVVANAAKSVGQLADEVLAGLHGTGDARKAALGAQYGAVQDEINRRSAVPKAKSVSQLADEVLAGKHGIGDARKKSLGSQYAAVQAEINRRAVNEAKNKTVAQLADEVIAGKHGTGAARQKSLGAKFNAVQAEINRRYGF